MRSKCATAEVKSKMPSFASVTRWSLALVLFGAMGSGAMLLSTKLQDPKTFPLKVVQIKGDFRYLDRKKLEQVMATQLREGFFTLDVEKVHSKFLQMPWVAQLALRRVWPDKLLITVEEQVPLARWGKQQLVNVQGELFRPAKSEIPAGLPHLDGPEGTEREMVTRYRMMQLRFEAVGLQIARVQQDLRSSWFVEFTDKSAIRLGSQHIDERLGRFIRLYPRLRAAGRGKPRQVDLRYTNGFVVHWEEQSILSKQALAKRDELG